MNKPYRKIISLLIIIILVPTIILSIYQISSLNQSEKNIETIYSSELNTLLASINDYVNDYITSWARKLNLLVVETPNVKDVNFQESVKKFLLRNQSIKMLILTDKTISHRPEIISNFQDTLSNIFQKNIKRILVSNKNKIKVLLQYNESGSRKIEAVTNSKIGNNVLVIFLLELPEGDSEICGLLVDPEIFIKQILSKKINSITRNEFVVFVSNQKNNTKVFSSGENYSTEIEQHTVITLLPGYSINIMLKGATISGLVKERSVRNIIIVFLINLFLIIGLWFVLRNFKKETELANQQSNFIANVSHELRTPLSLINLFSETLVMGRVKDREKEKEYFKIINDESNRLSRIVDKILSFYAIEENRKKYNFNSENLNLIVENVLQAYGYQIENNNFNIIFEPGGNMPDVRVDKEAVIEVIINLLDNAMKYSKDKKEIIIKTGFEKDFAYIKVIDSGIGISAVNQKKIFDKFYRVQGGLAQDAKGTGLGLTIVKSIMDAHQGKIEVESSEGKGSSFTLTFKQYIA
ncbi:MAG: sensor histidine kinase [Ignavibacteriaceae bacterium]